MVRLLAAVIFTFSFISPVSAQDSLLKRDIVDQMKVFRKCKKDLSRYLTSDSVYFVGSCRTSPEYNYVEFYSLAKTKEQRRNWIIYHFYFLKDDLVFIVQGKRNRKHFSEYYLNQGVIFSTDLDTSLPVLTEESINQLTTGVLAIRNKERK